MTGDAKFHELCFRYLDGTAKDHQIRDLEHMLAADPRLADHFIQLVSLHRQLGDWYTTGNRISADLSQIGSPAAGSTDAVVFADALAELAQAEASASASPVRLPDPPPPHEIRVAPRRPEAAPPGPLVIVIPWWAVVVSTAAAIALVAWVGFSVFTPQPSTPSNEMAADQAGPADPPPAPEVIDTRPTILAAAHGSGDPSRCTYRPGHRLDGEIVLDDETIEVRSHDGIVLVIQGPFEGRFTSVRELQLVRGKVLTDVSEGIGGFVVRTESAVYRDIGTVFGVGRDQARSDNVTVLEGEVVVEIDQPDSEGQRHRLTTGQAATLASEGGRFTRHLPDPDAYQRSVAEAAAAYRQQRVDAATLAFWRFERPDVRPGTVRPSGDLTQAGQATVTVPDVSGRRNHLFTGSPIAEIRSGQLPVSPLHSAIGSNHQAFYMPGPGLVDVQDLHTWSGQSNPARRFDLQSPRWDQLTIELSFLVELADVRQTLLNLDGDLLADGGSRSAFALGVEGNRVFVEAFDAGGGFHRLVSERLVEPGVWMHAAVVIAEGEARLLLAEAGAPPQYREVARGSLPGGLIKPAARLWDGQPQTWVVGRGRMNNVIGDEFRGYIDEIRFCEMALKPADFVFPGTLGQEDAPHQ